MICPDCKGSGQYQGLLSVETCQKCAGTGQIAVHYEQVGEYAWEITAELSEAEKESLRKEFESFEQAIQRTLILSGGSTQECHGEDK